MASKLKAVDPKKAMPSKPKVLIYGKPGVGKTWTSLDFPNVYYIDTEGGADLQHYTDKLKAVGGMYFGPEQGSLDFNEVIGQIQALATEEHQFKTVVIDSFTKLYNSFAADAAEKMGDDFGRDKKEANKPTRRLINWLNRLDMNVILIAHQKDEWGKDSKGERTVVGETFDAWDKLEYELHLCLQIYKQGSSRKARVRKSRLIGFPDGDIFDWSYKSFADRYGKDIIEGASMRLQLATEAQLKEIKALLDVVKLEQTQIDKWLKAGNAESWEEMESDKVDKVIKHIRTKFLPDTKGEAA